MSNNQTVSEGTDDPALAAIIVYVEEMCRLAVSEATGFHTASIINAERDVARAAFIKAMNQATQDTGP